MMIKPDKPHLYQECLQIDCSHITFTCWINTGFGQITKVECMSLKVQVSLRLLDIPFLFLVDKFKCAIKLSQLGINLFFNVPGSFIRENGLEVGDWISLYEDDSKNFVSFSYFLSRYNSINLKIFLHLFLYWGRYLWSLVKRWCIKTK